MMLGKTANGLFWMARSIERAANTARLVETGQRMALIRSGAAEDEWRGVIEAAGVSESFAQRHGPSHTAPHVIDYLLRDPSNAFSATASIENARTNARMVRTAITREVWEAVNEMYLDMRATLAKPVNERDLPDVLDALRRHGALIRGMMVGTMLRNAIFDFMELGLNMERADNVARILDVKYHVLLPRDEDVGGALDTAQWEQLLYSVHVRRAYLHEYGADYRAVRVAEFLILNPRMPRSLRFCAKRVADQLDHLADETGHRTIACDRARERVKALDARDISSVFADGLHEVLTDFIAENAELSNEIARTYRFVE